jgi:hypothetical protein
LLLPSSSLAEGSTDRLQEKKPPAVSIARFRTRFQQNPELKTDNSLRIKRFFKKILIKIPAILMVFPGSLKRFVAILIKFVAILFRLTTTLIKSIVNAFRAGKFTFNVNYLTTNLNKYAITMGSGYSVSHVH